MELADCGFANLCISGGYLKIPPCDAVVCPAYSRGEFYAEFIDPLDEAPNCEEAG